MQLMIHVIQMLDCYTRICFSKLWIPSTVIAWTYTFKCVCKYICAQRENMISLLTQLVKRSKKKSLWFLNDLTGLSCCNTDLEMTLSMSRLEALHQLQLEKLHIPMGMILFCVEQVIMACGYRESLMASKC